MEKQDLDVIAIHTHDRIAFRRCRRKWAFSSELRHHLVQKDSARAPLWFGTGIHFALEDYHGYHKFSTPAHAFQAYYNAYKQHFPNHLPSEHEDLLELGIQMLQYYVPWLKQRDEFKTLWIDGIPQVEVPFSIEIPQLSAIADKPVHYQGTIDRVVVDPYGRFWVEDYKTYKQFDTSKLELDPQISAYCWGAEHHYQREIEGMLYLQLKKIPPKPPRMTKQGISVDKKQHTTHALVTEALIREGYDLNNLPKKYSDYLDYLVGMETLEGDRFIRWDRVRRNAAQKQHEYDCIIAEGLEMLNPDLAIYHNPTRDCSWDCDFLQVCLAITDGSDWQWLLEEQYEKKEGEPDWRSKLVWEDPQLVQIGPELQLSL